MNEDLRRMNVLQTLDELAHHDGRDKAQDVIEEWRDKNPVSESSPFTDEQRLSWLIKKGAYSLIDHDSYYLQGDDLPRVVRERIDKYIRESNEGDQP